MYKKCLFVLIMVLFSAHFAYSHEVDIPHEETADETADETYQPYISVDESFWPYIGLIDPVIVLIAASFISSIAALVGFMVRSHASEKTKKLLFASIAVPVVIATIYLSASTVYLNIISVTDGPVHWHADYEVWACGESYELVDPRGFENRTGPTALHEHNDNRIHVEGLLLDLKQASVSEFFRAVGGDLTKEKLIIPTNDGLKEWKNGDLCNGIPGEWHVFVNGIKDEEYPAHILAPFSTVPPGDKIKFVFTEKNVSEINTMLGEAP